MDIKIIGLPELKANIKKLEQKAQTKLLKTSSVAAAIPVKESISAAAPKDRGKLSMEIQVGTTRTTINKSETEVGPTKSGFWGKYQEFGIGPHYQPGMKRTHPGHAAQPFMRPGLDNAEVAAVAAVAAVFKQGLRL